MATRTKALLGLFLLLGSCNDEGKTTPEIKNDSVVNNITSTGIVDSLSSGCYSQIVQRDTASLQLENKNSIINGSLSYNIYQKDRNDGTLQAEVTGNIIQGWYLFKSEGIVSVRQVSWKVNEDELWPAMGEVIQKNDTTMFAQPDKLKYDSVHPFKKVPCII
jgi:hypothetical protein